MKAKGHMVVVFVCLSFCIAQPAQASLQFVIKRVGSLLLSEGIDVIWNKATGKPDVGALNRRLVAVEEVLEHADKESAKIIRNLRSSVTQDTSREEYSTMAAEAFTKLHERLRELETTVARNEQAVRELDERLSRVERKIDSDEKQFPATKRSEPPTDESEPRYPTSSANLIGSWQGGYLFNGIPVTTVYTFYPDGLLSELTIDPYGRSVGDARYVYTQGQVYIEWPNGSERAVVTWMGADQFHYHIVSHTDWAQVGLEIIYRRVFE